MDILKANDNIIEFAKWSDELSCYVPNDGQTYEDEEEATDVCANETCPWVRVADVVGNITAQMVVAVRYNGVKKVMEIMTTENPSDMEDGGFYDIHWADGISYWAVFDYIEEWVENHPRSTQDKQEFTYKEMENLCHLSADLMDKLSNHPEQGSTTFCDMRERASFLIEKAKELEKRLGGLDETDGNYDYVEELEKFEKEIMKEVDDM